MRITRQRSKHIDTGTKRDGNRLEAFGLSNENETLPTTKFKNYARSYLDRRAQLKNLVWSYHLGTILTADGLGITILTIIDEYTQECLSSLADNYITIENVLDELFNVFLNRGIPKRLIAFDDNELIPNAICEWLENLEITGTLVELKKYGENGYGLLFKDHLLKGLLHERSFASLGDVKSWLASWRSEHNRSMNLVRK